MTDKKDPSSPGVAGTSKPVSLLTADDLHLFNEGTHLERKPALRQWRARHPPLREGSHGPGRIAQVIEAKAGSGVSRLRAVARRARGDFIRLHRSGVASHRAERVALEHRPPTSVAGTCTCGAERALGFALAKPSSRLRETGR